MLEAVGLAHLYAAAEEPVILIGETGTGKSFLARRIHEWSGRGGTLAEKSAGELESGLAPDEVFGHERGAFTGALGRRLGLFAEAGQGTVLLDDFHLLGRGGQALLLRVLDQGEYRPLGADRRARVMARVVVGSGRDLDDLVREGVLLPDLRYRLGYLVIRVPRLAERREDIAVLAQRFLAECATALGASGRKRFAPEAIASLQLAPWPGNVRELVQVVRAAYIRARDEEVIRYHHLPPEAQISARFRRRGDLSSNLRAVRWALWRSGGNASRAADLIGAHRNTVAVLRRELERLESGEPGAGPIRAAWPARVGSELGARSHGAA